MRILWTVNILFPEAKALLEKKPSTLASSGGWLIGAAQALAARDDIELHIACPARVDSLQVLQGERIRYYLFPVIAQSGEPFFGDYPPLDAVFKDIIGQVRPDLIDIHGTEYAHGLSCWRVSAGIPTVVTLQGFIHAVAEHYREGIDNWTLYAHEIFHHGSIRQEQKGYFLRGAVEKNWLRQIPHFIGRTEWDRQTVLSLNPDARYHVCQETLRDPFYTGKWTWEACEKHSIFASQGSYPLKGLHQVLKALPDVLKKYPDTVLYVGGWNIVEGRHPGHYGRILRSMIRRWKLEDKVRFTGNLDAEEMKRRYLLSNVFVCPSTNENSPNSLGEAQILGVPCIASRVGGIPSMIPDGQCGILYPFEDTKALAAHICEVFAQEAAFDNTPMQEMARKRHDPANNTRTLLDIYREVAEEERLREKHYLMVALDAAYTAPGIVFKSLIRSLAKDHRITLLSQNVDSSLLTDSIRLIPLQDGVEGWRKAEKKWRRLGHNPRDERWAKNTFLRYQDELLKERYDALLVLCSNGYYSSLNLGSILREHIHCPYIIYSVDGMPSPLPWLDNDPLLHGNISAELNRLCAKADLFLLSNPQMTEYQKGILTDFKGTWDYLFTPYRELPASFKREKHEGFNILYAGSLYGLRKIDGLVDAFRRFLAEKPDARLTFVGDIWEAYKEYGKDLIQQGKLVFQAPTDRVDEYYATADCLIDIAADIPDDVFLSSKVICYLPYEIPIIAISGANSPVSQIMGGVDSILQCHNDADEILEALRKTLLVRDFSDRKELLNLFNADHLAERFKNLVEKQEKKEELIVSFTTWKARFENIPTVLDSIFRQSLLPDRIVLNLAEDEVLPDSLQQYLEAHAVEINRVPDTKVYKKLLPTLKKYPDACIVNIDDDFIYPPEMLEEFMRIHQQHPSSPISGNRERAYFMACHCGCASLTKREYFGEYLERIDEDVIAHCPSDDLVFSYFATKNGHPYLHTDTLYFTNMTPCNPVKGYSPEDGAIVRNTWDYLCARFGPLKYPSNSSIGKWFFELNRDRENKKFLRFFGIKIYLSK